MGLSALGSSDLTPLRAQHVYFTSPRCRYRQGPPAREAVPPTHLEYGYCDGTEGGMMGEMMISITPFPIELHTGHKITIEASITLNQDFPVGTSVEVELVKEGLISINIPCIHIPGVGDIGSCTYDGDEVLAWGGYTTPLPQGAFTVGPTEFAVPELPD